jgi:hypothetical protein
MRQNAYWMKKEDDRILEILKEETWSSPKLIASRPSIDISEGHIRERLMFLWYAGLVYQIWDDGYEITSEGLRYLDGQLDASHQPWPTVDRVLRGRG